LPELLEAVVRQAPETAPICARAAVEALPGQAGQWVGRVVSAAPGYAAAVVGEVCGAVPDQYAAVTVAAGRAAPLSTHSIVFALTEALPDLRETVERAKTLVGQGRTSHPSVEVLIYQAVELAEAEEVESAREEAVKP
jgi:hypothetical protein